MLHRLSLDLGHLTLKQGLNLSHVAPKLHAMWQLGLDFNLDHAMWHLGYF